MYSISVKWKWIHTKTLSYIIRMIVMICYILKDYYIQPFSYFRFEIVFKSIKIIHLDNKFQRAQYDQFDLNIYFTACTWIFPASLKRLMRHFPPCNLLIYSCEVAPLTFSRHCMSDETRK